MLLGAVDLGSNSFRVEIGRVINGRIVTQTYWKETIRLAAGFDKDGALTPEIQERALTALRRFNEKLAGLPASQVRAVGTQAMRIATNSEEFLEKAQAALGYPIDILSGHEEARLVFKGCSHSLPSSDKRRLIVDIGGASTEFVIGRGTEAEKFESFRVGCVNTSVKYFSDGMLNAKRFDRAVLACCAVFEEAQVAFNAVEFDEAYGSAGTFGAVSDVCVALGLSDGEVRPEHLNQLRKMLIKAENVNHIAIDGLKPDRKEVIAGGLAVLTAVFKTLGVTSMRPTAGALRLGLLYEQLGLKEDRDTRDLTVQSILKSGDISRPQAECVGKLSVELLAKLNNDSASENIKRLHWAALLHEIGTMVSTSRYHRHSEYIIRNADLPGFSRTDRDIMANLVLGQRGGLAKLGDFLLNSDRLDELLALRLAVILAHARQPVELPALSINRNAGSVSIAFPGEWLESHPLTAYLLEQECQVWDKTPRHLDIHPL